jgi:hypothetical protein
MPRTLSVPDFDFTGFYYPQLLEALIRYLRDNVPELSNETPSEPAIQIARAWALMGHQSNVLTDLVAHESLFPTCQLRDSLVAHLKLIGYEVAGDVPAVVEMVLQLAKTYTSAAQVLPDNALFGTRRTADTEPVLFEADNAVSVSRTDQLTSAKVFDASPVGFVDRTTEANTDSSSFSALPAVPAPNDCLYVGHDTAMTNRIKVVDVGTAMADITGVWEYYDGDYEDDAPDSVANLGSTLKLVIDSMLDDDGSIEYTGLFVRVTHNASGAYEDLVSQHDGSNNYVETTGFLGQGAPSTDASDYTVGAEWHRLPELDDDTNAGNTTLEQDGNVDFSLPKDILEDWQPGEVDGVTAFWIRFRVVTLGGSPVGPVIDRLKWSERDTFVQVDATQGRTRSQDPIASGTGDPDQEVVLGSSPVIPDTVRMWVEGEEWEEVENFLNSTSVDQHFTVEIDSDGVATVAFGDGTTGAIPPSGVNNIAAEYRTDAEEDGNVGANTITVNRSGVAGIRKVFNPLPATQWVARRGSTADDRELLKVEGPAWVRTLGRAVSTDDIEYLATHWQASDGTYPIARAKAIEEGLGPKTVKLVVVGPGGTLVSLTHREALEEYFNGNSETGTAGIMVANQRVYAYNFTPNDIDVQVVLTGGDVDLVEEALTGFLSPVATLEDGVTYRWAFGQTVTRSKITAAIMAADPDVEDLNLIQPAANVPLAADELPSPGTITVS